MEQNISINKIGLCTDIHFGAKSNSKLHNQDCLDYLDWFCDNIRNDTSIDAIGFLGDWNENRSALNIETLNHSYKGAKKLNDLGIPVFFVVGNHDLYHRHNREFTSIIPFEEFTNFIVVNDPIVATNSVGDDILFCPFIFHHEYADLVKYLSVPLWMGHFEFKGFLVTGYGVKMPTGPNPADFKGPKHILSGHFHKRQNDKNITYIGNTFPTNYGDAGDIDRGMATYDLHTENLVFLNWLDCPKYISVNLTSLLNEDVKIYPNTRIKCVVDVPISYEESTLVRETYIKKYNLREFTMEESAEIQAAMSDTEIVDWDETEWVSTDELVIHMLGDIDTPHIQNDMLINIYTKLKSSELAPDKN